MNSKGRRRTGYLFLIPSIFIIVVFIAYPVLNTAYTSFLSLRIQTIRLGGKFVGLKNYIDLFQDPLFIQALKFTCLFTVVAVVLETVLGMVCALIMNRKFKGQSFVRAAILIPWAIPTIVSGLMWQFMFAESYGIINQLLQSWGVISEPIKWVTGEKYAFWSVIISDVWKTSPYMSLLLLSGLQTISKELYEAAAIDGAGAIKRFWYITIPMLKPVLMVSLLFRTIQSFRIYDLVSVLTSGGPANSTQSLTLFTVKNYFQFGNLGYGAAAAMVTFVISMVIAMFFADGIKSKMEVPKKK